MSVLLGNQSITSGTDALFQGAPHEGVKAILIGNESGLTVTITMEGGGVQKTLYPSTVDWFQVKQGFTGTIRIHPISILNNVSTFPASSLVFDAIGLDDPEQASMYPISLTRNTNVGNSINTTLGTASAVQNDGSTAGTSIVESTVLGDGASGVSLTNAGHLSLGTVTNNGLFHFVGSAGNVDIASTGAMSVDNKINFNLATAETGNDFTVNVATGHKIALQNNGSDAVDINGSGLQLANGFKFLSQSGHTLQDWNAGFQGGVTSGGTTITHGLKANGVATTPTAIFVCLDNGGSSIVATAANAGTTTFQLFTNNAGASNVWWIAILM
jgi:hypothetical protein